jgi:phosphoribosylaminoimidazole-succinocarboxamide synthase
VADEAGFILADTKYEFGFGPDGTILLIDEVHTPDSSRFWRADTFERRIEDGLDPESHDKEPMRLALRATGWTGDGEIPELDDQAWIDTSTRYIEFYDKLTGSAFEPGDYPVDARVASALSTEVSP